MKENQKELDELIQEVMDQMRERRYGKKIVTRYRSSFQLLMTVSHDIGDDRLSEKLIKAFLDRPVSRGEKWAQKELTHRKRCIRLLLSLARTGTVDWRRQDTDSTSGKLMNKGFRLELESFVGYLEQKEFSPNTISGYKRIVTYFLLFCQKNGYGKLSDIQTNDVSTLILSLYKDGRYRPSTIGSGLARLRRFLSANDHTAQFLLEIPVHLPREVKIIEIYNGKELAALRSTLSSGGLTKRDTAVCRLLLETGLRGIDVCSLKLKDIDWGKDCISIIQNKTKKTLTIPLRASYGNDIADYILNERPQSKSDYVFLKTFAPFGRLGTGSIYETLKKLEELAGIKKEGRPVGSRMTRHHAASSMLRAGIPMSDISAALGHRDPNIVSVYLSTDAISLAACTLPPPLVGKGGIPDVQ
uniref:tyrosine-type recombinase/integrase n=1 Tax=Enterocloster clostridioformis TaxID=1531 RepID=UPI002676D316|nr:tyrosine-type recombinase/integrase [Enterocloster clostridioformis]